MNLKQLTQKGFTVFADNEVYAERTLDREDDNPLKFRVFSTGEIYFAEMYEDQVEDIIFVGEVNSAEQAMVLFDMINAINILKK